MIDHPDHQMPSPDEGMDEREFAEWLEQARRAVRSVNELVGRPEPPPLSADEISAGIHVEVDWADPPDQR